MGAAGMTKAVFQLKVDKYAQLSVDSLRALMGSRSWNAKKAHSSVWLGAAGRRTIGQRAGTLDPVSGNCSLPVGGQLSPPP